MLDQLCFAEFFSSYIPTSSIDYDQFVNDNQPLILTNDTIECNHNSINLPTPVPLMHTKETLRCRKVKKVLRYFTQ